MRTLTLVVLFLGLLPTGARTASPRFTAPTERIPNADPVNAFPRWMAPSFPTIGYVGMAQTTATISGRALAVDSRNAVHTLEANAIPHGSEFPAPYSGVPSWGQDHVAYKVDLLDRRRISGFSAPVILEDTYASWVDGDASVCELVHSPAIAVDASDRIHAVWVHTHWDANPANTYSWINYRMKDSNGWGATTNLTSGDGNTSRYNSLQLKLATNGDLHVVAVVSTYSQPQGFFASEIPSWLSEIVRSGGVTTITIIPGSSWAVGVGEPPIENDGPSAPRLVLDSSNNPVVVWQQRYSTHDPGTGLPTGTYFQVYTNSKFGGGWGSASTFAETPSLGGISNRYPDVALDGQNNRYFVWTRSLGASTTGSGDPQYWWQLQDTYPRHWFTYPDNRLYFSSTSEFPSQLASSTTVGRGSLLFDSRGQIHAAWGTNTTGGYAARIKNPGPGLNPTWRMQEPSGAGNTYSMAISKNDQIHLSDGVGYTKTLEYGVGLRDPAANVGLLRHASANVSSGNLHYRLPLFSSTGVGPATSMALVYNSLDPCAGDMAAGWKLNYQSYVVDHQTGQYVLGDTITVFMGDGRPIRFHYDATLSYLVASDEFGFFGKLERTALGSTSSFEYLLTLKNGTILRFNNIGWLWKVEEPNGNYLAMSYSLYVDPTGNNNFRLSAVTDMLGNGELVGRTTLIGYEDRTSQLYDPRLLAVLDPQNRGYQLAYTGNDLTSVAFLGVPGPPTYSFAYPGPTPGAGEFIGCPKTITMPRGNAWGISYLPDGRFQRVTAPSSVYLLDSETDGTAPTPHQAQLAFSFDETQALNLPRVTTVTDPRSFNTLYKVDARRSLVLQIDDPSVAPPAIQPVIRTFDAYGNLTDVQDRWGFHTTYVYFATGQTPACVRDNLKEVWRPKEGGTGQDLVESYTYTADGYNNIDTRTTKVTPTGEQTPVDRVTTYTYDTFGQLTEILYPNVNQPWLQQTNVKRTIAYQGSRYAVSRIVNEENHGVTYSDWDTTNKHYLPKSVLADGGTQHESRVYDNMGNLTGVTAPRGGASNDAPGATTYSYDGLYRLNVVTDPSGRSTIYNYDFDNNLTTVTPPAGGQTTTTFDARGLVSVGSSPDGSWTQVADANGNVKRSTNERGFATNRTIDSLNRVTQTRVPGASTLAVGQGGGGPAIHTTNVVPEGFDGSQHFSTVTEVGTPNRVTNTTYDARGRVTQVLEADLATKHETFYNELDQVVATQKRFNGTFQNGTVMFRDARDRVDKVRVQDVAYPAEPASGEAHQQNSYTIYNKAGAVYQSVSPKGDPISGYAHKTTLLRDVRERVQYVVDGMGVIVQENIYGDDDLLIESKVPNPATKTSAMTTAFSRTYTARKELKDQRDILGNGTSYAYNSLPGQVATATDAAGKITRTLYDPATQRPTTVIEAEGTADENRTHHVWTNGFSTQTKVFNPVTGLYDATFTKTYDQAGRLERIESPTVAQTQTAPERFFYNEFGESSQHIAGVKTVTNTYNALGQNTQTAWTGAFSATTTRTYNGAGLTETVSDGSKSKTMFYDIWKGTPSTESIAVGGGTWKVQTHTYDAAGNPTGFGDAEGGQHGWPVDENNRPTQMKHIPPGQSEVILREMTYTPGGLVDKEILKSAAGATIATTTHTYDSLGNRKGSQTVKAGMNEILTDFAWDHDTRHQITGIHLRHLGAVFTMTVDGRGRTKTQSTPGNNNGQNAPSFTNQFGGTPTGNVSTPTSEASGVPQAVLVVAARSVIYNFHPSGNRTTATVDGVVATTYTYNAANQLTLETKPGGITVEHAYDQWGNESTRTTKLNGNVISTESYGYNHLNRMSSYMNSQTGANWQYDFYPTGERYAKTNVGANTSELYVPRFDDVATEYQKVGAGAATLKNTYVQGLGIDQKQLRIALDGTRRHLLGDQVGTIGMTLDDAGGTIETSVKDAWGVQCAGATNERYGGIAQREIDTESGLTYMRHRMYDPLLGRFTQGDPILARRPFAHYTYADNNPIQHSDPTGAITYTNGLEPVRGESMRGDPWTAKRRDIVDYFFAMMQSQPASDKVASLWNYAAKSKTKLHFRWGKLAAGVGAQTEGIGVPGPAESISRFGEARIALDRGEILGSVARGIDTRIAEPTAEAAASFEGKPDDPNPLVQARRRQAILRWEYSMQSNATNIDAAYFAIITHELIHFILADRVAFELAKTSNPGLAMPKEMMSVSWLFDEVQALHPGDKLWSSERYNSSSGFEAELHHVIRLIKPVDYFMKNLDLRTARTWYP